MSGAVRYQILFNSSDVDHLDWSIPLLLSVSNNSSLLLLIFNVSANILWPLLKQTLGRKHDFTHVKNAVVILLKAFYITAWDLILVVHAVRLSLEHTATKIMISPVFETVQISKQSVIYIVGGHFLGVW